MASIVKRNGNFCVVYSYKDIKVQFTRDYTG